MKKSRLVGAHVSVAVEIPTRWRDTSDAAFERRLRDDADAVARSVRRHVDGHSCVGVVFESEHTCEYCGATWTEKGDAFNGGCCDKDAANDPNPEVPK